MRSTEVTGVVHERGRDAYRRKEYTTALACFDRAIARGGPSAQLLDNRAACHEKLNSLPLALKDAKATIQAWRDDPTGYLRAGKILVQMDKPSTAFEVFSHGLRTVRHVGQGYETLRKAHEDLQAKVAPRKSVDPMTVLPRELAEQVLEYLTFRQRMNACMVSMAWTQFVRSVPNLWTHLDLTHARSKVRSVFISRAINTARTKIQYATLNGRLESFDKTINALLHHCNMRELTLLDTGIQSEGFVMALGHATHLEALRLGAGTPLTALAFRDLLKHNLPALKQLRLHGVGDRVHGVIERYNVNLRSLQELNLRVGHDYVSMLSSSHFLGQLPNLKTLQICDDPGMGTHRSAYQLRLDFSILPVLETLYIELHRSSLHPLVLPPTILNLTLRVSKSGTNASQSTTTSLPILESLTLHGNPLVEEVVQSFLQGPADASVLKPVSKLRRLIVGNSWHYSSTASKLRDLLAHDRLSELGELRLPRHCAVMDEVFLASPMTMKTLQTLDLSGTDITGVGVRAILQHKQLKHLIVNNCTSLGRDAVDLAIKKGVKVDYRVDQTK